MNTDTETKPTLGGQKSPADRGMFVFIAVGLVIVLGGLWMLYGASGPYHP